MHDRFFNPDRFIRSSLIASAEGDPPGGGGGDDKAKPVLAADVEGLVKGILDKSLNGAIKTQLTRLMGGDAFKTSLAEIVKTGIGDSVKEALEAARAEQVEGQHQGEGGQGGAGGKTKAGQQAQASVADSAEYKALMKKVDAITKERDDEKAKASAAADERRVTDEKTAFTEALTKAGVAPKRVKAAVALLYTEEKRLVRNEEGKFLFKDDDGAELPLADGLKEWTAGEVGQEFLPARPVQGSGGTGGSGGSSGGKGGAPELSSLMGGILGGT